MIFVTFDDLRASLDLTSIPDELLVAGFRFAKSETLWTNYSKLHDDAVECAILNNWDPDTALCLYDRQKTEEEKAAIAEQTARVIAEDADWDDIQIGASNDIVVSVYPNMTLERLCKIIAKPYNMRAFL